jgi:hypothetical protein
LNNRQRQSNLSPSKEESKRVQEVEISLDQEDQDSDDMIVENTAHIPKISNVDIVLISRND